MLGAWRDLFSASRQAFKQRRTHERAAHLSLASLLCPGRHTITGLLCAQGAQFQDWSASYRLFERERFDAGGLFAPILQGVVDLMPEGHRICVSMDTTLFGKRGKKVYGARYRRDPMGPPFMDNLIWSQRYLQTSVLLPESFDRPSRARALPVALRHCPGVKGKMPKGATMEEKRHHRQAAMQAGAPMSAAQQLADLRRQADAVPGGEKCPIVAAVDGGLTNKTLLANLPPRTAVIGRLRKDAVLFSPPAETGGRGRPRCYGERLATPDQIRRDDDAYPWQKVRVFAAGKEHDMRVKTVSPVRWRGLGAADARLVIIAPLAYRPSAHSGISYRDPAYLICTDPELDLQALLQTYIWRWEIEVNFREQKTIMGVGEAQVRTAQACETVPQLLSAAYSMLLLAEEKLRRAGDQNERRESRPLPKWRREEPPRPSVQQLVNDLRAEILRRELEEMNLTDFDANDPAKASREKRKLPYIMAPVYSQK